MCPNKVFHPNRAHDVVSFGDQIKTETVMGTKPCDFKVKNSTRALAAAMSAFTKAGIAIGRAEIDSSTGNAVVIPKSAMPTTTADADAALEAWKARNAGQA
jgi:hypothetical protein